MQYDIVQGSVRSSRTLAGDRDAERPFVVHIKQTSFMPYLIVFFLPPFKQILQTSREVLEEEKVIFFFWSLKKDNVFLIYCCWLLSY